MSGCVSRATRQPSASLTTPRISSARLVFVEMPEAGAEVAAGDELGSLESVKAVADFFAPLSGSVSAVNERLEDEPDLVNTDPYGEGWLVQLESIEQPEGLMSPDEYAAFLAEEQS